MAQRLRLGDFVATAVAEQGLELDPSRPPFTRQHSPILRPNRAPNRLLFPGSFNPPHRGHRALLDHVLHTADAYLGLAAAIIIPTDDDKLAAKNSKDERPLLLTQAQRAQLWCEAGLPRDRVWVFEGSEDSWKLFRAGLQRRTVRHRIDLKFVLLVGPDWISSTAASDPKSWGCSDAITSDVSRAVDFRCPHSLRQLPACSVWEPCSLSTDARPSNVAAGKTASEGPPTQQLSVSDRSAFPSAPADSMSSQLSAFIASTSWKCETLRKPLCRYYVPSPQPRFEWPGAPSSTEIRRIVALRQGRRLKEELDKLAISPSLLLRYVLEGGPYSVPAIRDKPLDHEARKAKADEHVVW